MKYVLFGFLSFVISYTICMLLDPQYMIMTYSTLMILMLVIGLIIMYIVIRIGINLAKEHNR